MKKPQIDDKSGMGTAFKYPRVSRAARRLFASILLLGLGTGPGLLQAQSAGAPSRLSQSFDSAQEFPNYFMPAKYRNLSFSQIPEEVLRKQHDLLDSALASVFDRLVVPIVPEGEKSVKLVRYFPYLKSSLSKIDPKARIYASGGVVRTAISYLYDEIYQRLEKDPTQDPNRILEEISRSREDLPAIRVRGIGSDFDVLIDSSPGKLPELQKRALEITNSASGSVKASVGNHAVTNTFFTFGDVRDYKSQIERSTRQGGTVVDYLAFDVGAQKLTDPERFPDLTQSIVAGRYQFAPPVEGAAPEDLGDSVIRGARTALELPWLKLENEDYFKSQIQALKKSLSSGRGLSSRALGQFAKGVRNSRYFGAHNRFYRAKHESAEHEILELATTLGNGNPSKLLPEFADSQKIALRMGDHSELNGLSSENLMPLSAFKEKYTNHGVLHHGTPSLDNGLAILRQGLFLSKEGQGKAAFGRGVYSSPDRKVSEGYAGPQGVVFDLELKDDPRINILDWSTAQSSPDIRHAVAEAAHQGRDPFEYLSREHGIDIIVNHHVLIQNSDALVLNGNLRPVAQSLLRDIASEEVFNPKALTSLFSIDNYLTRIGEKSVLTPDEYQAIVLKGLRSLTAKWDSLEVDLDFVKAALANPNFHSTPEMKSAIESLATKILKNPLKYMGKDVALDKALHHSLLAIPDEELRSALLKTERKRYEDELGRIFSGKSTQIADLVNAHIKEGAFSPTSKEATRLASFLLRGGYFGGGMLGDETTVNLLPFIDEGAEKHKILGHLLKSANDKAFKGAVNSINWEKNLDPEFDRSLIQGFVKGHSPESSLNALQKRPTSVQTEAYQGRINSILNGNNLDTHFIDAVLQKKIYSTSDEKLAKLSIRYMAEAHSSTRVGPKAGLIAASLIQDPATQAKVLDQWLRKTNGTRFAVLEAFDWLGNTNELADQVLARALLTPMKDTPKYDSMNTQYFEKYMKILMGRPKDRQKAIFDAMKETVLNDPNTNRYLLERFIYLVVEPEIYEFGDANLKKLFGKQLRSFSVDERRSAEHIVAGFMKQGKRWAQDLAREYVSDPGVSREVRSHFAQYVLRAKHIKASSCPGLYLKLWLRAKF